MSQKHLVVLLGTLYLTCGAFLSALAGDEVPNGEFMEDLDYAQVEFVSATQAADGTWRFDVTVRHNDEGWDHYADVWQVIVPQMGPDERSAPGGADAELIAERVLLHPHDSEQPFTRSQSAITIPDDVTQVLVRAGCNVHGFGGRTVIVDLTATGGERYEVHSGGER